MSEEEQSASPPQRSSPAAVGLLTLGVLYTLWAAQALVLPVLLAAALALVANPVIRLMQRARIPRLVAALLLILSTLAGLGFVARQVVEPATQWAQELPDHMRQLAPKLRKMTRPVHDASRAAQEVARAAGGDAAETREQVVRAELNDPYRNLTATPRTLASVLAVVLLAFFFIVYGGRLVENGIALLHGFRQKRITVEILQSIEREISRYVLTISVINLLLGCVFACCLFFVVRLPFDQALLGGLMAMLLNFAPYVGPLLGIAIMLVLGFSTYDQPLRAVIPAVCYFSLHLLEGQLITPIVLGKRMAISPLVLILGLAGFGWLWGFVGLLLAVPLLVCLKIVLTKVDGWQDWAHLLE